MTVQERKDMICAKVLEPAFWRMLCDIRERSFNMGGGGGVGKTGGGG